MTERGLDRVAVSPDGESSPETAREKARRAQVSLELMEKTLAEKDAVAELRAAADSNCCKKFVPCSRELSTITRDIFRFMQ